MPGCCGTTGYVGWVALPAAGTSIASMDTKLSVEAAEWLPVTTIRNVWSPAVRPVLLKTTAWLPLPESSTVVCSTPSM